MINAIAIDDEPPALLLLSSYCEHNAIIDLKKTFTSPLEALKYLQKYPVDLVFLDIQMPGISGTEFRKKLSSETIVIFTTAYSDYAVEGFNLDVVDFLLKPYTIERFNHAVEKANQYFTHLHQKATSANPNIFLRADYGLVKIPLNDLLYVEGLEDYCKFYFMNEAPKIFRITMKSLMEKLPETQFIRPHRSYIVRIDKCERIKGGLLTIGGMEISIGRIYKEQVFKIFKNSSKE